MKLIDGKKISTQIKEELSQEVLKLKQDFPNGPGLAVILVGDDPASQVYVRNKQRSCQQIGIRSIEHKLPAQTSEEDLLQLVKDLNNDKNVDGILVQLPLPKHIDEDKVIESIEPTKDVDGFHPTNVGKMMIGQETFLPCTPYGIQELLRYSNIETSGKHVVVVGRSNIVGKPIAMMMVQKGTTANATVTITHSRTADLTAECQRADILIAAIGMPKFIKGNMVKDGVVVIDVGINRIKDCSTKTGTRLVGDVDFEEVSQKASAITPVPGGVGPMTIAMLMVNTISSFKRRNNLK